MTPGDAYQTLTAFLRERMSMSHVYQPVMIRELLQSGGAASCEAIARALLNEDRSQIEYYEAVTRDMVGRVLRKNDVVTYDKGTRSYTLNGFDQLTPSEIESLERSCDEELQTYINRRGDAIWAHRRKSTEIVSGTIRYDVLKTAGFRCELCGVTADERALEVDHILPRNKGGSNDRTNLQALCYRCNASKRDRDDTDFRAVRAGLARREEACPFCLLPAERIVGENDLALAIRDAYPVSPLHTLVIPKRHEAGYFQLADAEVRACNLLLRDQEAEIRRLDPSVDAFNVGINVGEVAGQTVMHCHIHLIPRRIGDVEKPRGGVRNLLPGDGSY